jgi:hypothetical protein
MFMCEDYNSPQSPYWCLKTLVAIALPDNDEFWTSKELPYEGLSPSVALVPTPQQIVCNHPGGNHHFMLSPSQFVAWPMKATQAKYCKFAYSSTFAFSVPTGPLIQQIAPDSALALSRDGAETWAVKWKCEETVFSSAAVMLPGSKSPEETVATASVVWYPWGDQSVSVQTTLVPPTNRWPDWHVRIHRIRVHHDARTLHTVEGGFALLGRRKADGMPLPNLQELPSDAELGNTECTVQTAESALVISSAGASGIVTTDVEGRGRGASLSYILKPDSNTNLACQRTLIPVSSHNVSGGLAVGDELVLTTSVFAISTTANGGWQNGGRFLKDRWQDVPTITFGETSSLEQPAILLA